MDQQAGWTIEGVQRLTELAREGLSAETISLALKRPVMAIRAKLGELGITVRRAESHAPA